MDAASVIGQTHTSLTTPTRVPLGFAGIVCLSVFVSFPCDLQAQTHIVEVATEPKFGGTPTSAPLATFQSRVVPESVEPERMQQPAPASPVRKPEVKTQPFNFLPAQRPIGQISIDARSKPKNGNNEVPENLAEKAMGQIPVVQASTSDSMFAETGIEKSRNHDQLFAYQPLYFEEANLERYGRACGPMQPVVSGVRFFATIPSLPYAMTVHQPNKTYTTRWPYEAGWGAPKVKELQPLQFKPSLVQAGAITGLIFVVP